MLSVPINDELEQRLRGEAERQGMDVADYAARLLQRALAVKGTGEKPNQATLDLLAEWDAQDETSDPAEARQRSEEAEQFMRNLDRNRREMEGPNARRLWP